ncbi:MAG: universal stress protein, partial [Brevundimonas sp.]
MPRKFLVVADDTPEFPTALAFAARRARATGGRVALLRVISPTHDEHW